MPSGEVFYQMGKVINMKELPSIDIDWPIDKTSLINDRKTKLVDVTDPKVQITQKDIENVRLALEERKS